MNRRDFLKFLGGTAAAAAVAPQTIAEAFDVDQCPSTLVTGFIVIEPGMNIQEAIDSLPREGGTVYFGSGTHIADQTISIPAKVRLVAEGSTRISRCVFNAKHRPQDDAPIVFLMDEDDNVEIINNLFYCKELKRSWFEAPIGDHLASLRDKMQRLCLKAKQLIT